MDLPLSTRLNDSTKNGKIKYQTSFENKLPQGFFSFSYYIPSRLQTSPASSFKDNIYLKGLLFYSKLIDIKDSIFQGWKLLIYTDSLSYTLLQKLSNEVEQPESERFLVNNPNITFVIVDWPYYDPLKNGNVNGDVMRIMRFRAFFDFPSVPIFVRDADTIFTNGKKDKNGIMQTVLEVEIGTIYEWEKNFYEGALNLPNTFIVGTSLNYWQPWHKNTLLQKIAPIGVFAGLLSTIPTVPCFESLSLWDQSIDYILDHSVALISEKNSKITYSNQDNKYNIGKDEQIPLFIYLPNCLKNIYFFELDVSRHRTIARRNINIINQLYPKIMFERGFNSTLYTLFEKSIPYTKNKSQLNDLVNLAKAENKKVINQRALKLFNEFNSLENFEKDIKINKGLRILPYGQDWTTANKRGETINIITDSSMIPYLSEIKNALEKKNANNKISTLFSQIENQDENIKSKKKAMARNFIFNKINKNITRNKKNLQSKIKKRNKTIKNFLNQSKSLSTSILENIKQKKKSYYNDPWIKRRLEKESLPQPNIEKEVQEIKNFLNTANRFTFPTTGGSQQ